MGKHFGLQASTSVQYYCVTQTQFAQHIRSNYVDIASGRMNPDHIHRLLSSSPNISGFNEEVLLGTTSLDKKLFFGDCWQCERARNPKYIEEQELHHKEDNFKISDY